MQGRAVVCTFISLCLQLKIHWAAAHSQGCFRWTGQMSNGPDKQTNKHLKLTVSAFGLVIKNGLFFK